MPNPTHYGGWSNWKIVAERELTGATIPPHGWGTPAKGTPPLVRAVVDLEEGSIPLNLDQPNADGKYCYNWSIDFCWTWDAQNRQMIYE